MNKRLTQKEKLKILLQKKEELKKTFENKKKK